VLAYGTSWDLLRCPFVSEIMHGRAPEVFLHQLSWNIAIWPILCRCDVKPKTNKQTNKQNHNEWLVWIANQNPLPMIAYGYIFDAIAANYFVSKFWYLFWWEINNSKNCWLTTQKETLPWQIVESIEIVGDYFVPWICYVRI
jgi:hypothetical protein